MDTLQSEHLRQHIIFQSKEILRIANSMIGVEGSPDIKVQADELERRCEIVNTKAKKLKALMYE